MEQAPKKENIKSYDELIAHAQKKLLELFPDLSGQPDDVDKIVDGFALDVLMHHGIPGAAIFHRLSPERQRELLANKNVAHLFDALPDSLIAFYRNKIKNPTQRISIDEIAEDF